jgi:hypothetical protein
VKAADLNTRISQATVDRIVMLCNWYTTKPYAVLPLVFKPARSTVLYRQSQSRIQIVARLVDEFGVYDKVEGTGTISGLDFEVMKIKKRKKKNRQYHSLSYTNSDQLTFSIGYH